jgi:hypothetical protein
MMSKVDHASSAKKGHAKKMASKSTPLTREEFASLLIVGNTSAVLDPPAIIPAEHAVRLIGLGYIADLAGRLRMTTIGRRRIAAGFEFRIL